MYFTDEARHCRGRLISKFAVEAMQHIHDLLRCAADRRLAVSMFVRSLPEQLDNYYYGIVERTSLTGSIAEILKHEVPVRILIWNKYTSRSLPRLVSSEMVELMGEYKASNLLDIRVSGTRELTGITAFGIIAQRDDEWVVRSENPRDERSEVVTDETAMPGVTVFETVEAKEWGQPFQEFFDGVFTAISSPNIATVAVPTLPAIAGAVPTLGRVQVQTSRSSRKYAE
jgi:hypothetical protein